MELLELGGYGGFVWGSYAVAAVVIVIELALLKSRRKRALAQARLELGNGA